MVLVLSVHGISSKSVWGAQISFHGCEDAVFGVDVFTGGGCGPS